jgi:exonuclease SbcC
LRDSFGRDYFLWLSDPLFGAKAKRLDHQIKDQRKQARVWQTLGALIGSRNGQKLRKFAQSLTLDVLLSHANDQLGELTARYELQRVPKADLALQVIDHDLGDEVRSTSSLSGGESFLVSLALALGLATLSSQRTKVESLFVDEGFGSLDAQNLETVLETLDALHATGRQIGLISHVPAVAERVGAQVEVIALGAGKSRVVLA